MNEGVSKRSITIAGHRTSISLEDVFWDALRDIAEGEGRSLSRLISAIDAMRGEANLSSAIRVHVLRHYRGLSAARSPQAPAGA